MQSADSLTSACAHQAARPLALKGVAAELTLGWVGLLHFTQTRRQAHSCSPGLRGQLPILTQSAKTLKRSPGAARRSTAWLYSIRISSKAASSMAAPRPRVGPCYPDGDEIRGGFWGPVTSSIDWCERNYTVTPYIAEFGNTLTNIGFVVLGRAFHEFLSALVSTVVWLGENKHQTEECVVPLSASVRRQAMQARGARVSVRAPPPVCGFGRPGLRCVPRDTSVQVRWRVDTAHSLLSWRLHQASMLCRSELVQVQGD